MNVQQKRKEKGFTIIEVVLVLAIAALIFLMVFIALPALQRGQRDTQRKDDLARVQTAIQQYQSNNRNSLPAAGGWADFTSKYLTVGGDSFVDPAGASTTQGSVSTYQFNETTGNVPTDFASAQNFIYVSRGYTCGTDGAVTAAGSTKIAARMKLEGGGVACVNN